VDLVIIVRAGVGQDAELKVHIRCFTQRRQDRPAGADTGQCEAIDVQRAQYDGQIAAGEQIE
jgi:hypothetical protein